MGTGTHTKQITLRLVVDAILETVVSPSVTGIDVGGNVVPSNAVDIISVCKVVDRIVGADVSTISVAGVDGDNG